MSVNFKSPVTSENFNDGFLDKNKDTSTIYKLSLNSPTSGGNLADVQQAINDNATSVTNHLLDYTAHRNFDIKSNLDTWALTADNGWLCYATDDKKSYQVTDGLLTEIGGGGGIAEWVTLTTYAIDDIIWLAADNKIYRCITANSDAVFTPANWTMLGGSTLETNIAISPNNNIQVTDNDGTSVLRSESEVLYIEDYKENDHTIFTGVSGTITLSSNTTTPIGKYRSLKADIVSGLANDSFRSPVIAVTDYMKSFGVVGFFSNTKFNGITGDMQYLVEFDNGTDWTTIPSQRFDIRNGDKLNKFLLQFDPTCVNFRYTPIITSAGDYVLEIGMVRLVSNPMPTAESVESIYVAGRGNGAGATTSFVTDIDFTETSDSHGAFDGTTFTAPFSGAFKVAGGIAHVSQIAGVSVYSYINGVQDIELGYSAAPEAYSSFSGIIYLNKGEQLTIRDNNGTNLANDTARHTITIEATASSSNVVFEGHATDTEWIDGGAITIDATTTAPTKGTTAHDKVFWKRAQDSMDGRFEYEQTTSGTAGSGTYLFTIPNGQTIDTAKVSSLASVNNDIRGAVVGGGRLGISNGENTLNNNCNVDVVVHSATQLKFVVNDYAGSLYSWSFGSANGATKSLQAATLNFDVTFSVPIQGWSVADPLISVPVTNEVENVYSARITSAGVITSQSSHFISSVTKGTAGIYTINLVSGFFSVIPSVEGAVEVQSDSVFSGTPTTSTITVEINSAGTKTDRDFSIVVQRQGSDYKAPKGYFLGNMARVNHLLGGVEYKTGEMVDGQDVWAVRYELTANISTNTAMPSLPANLTIVNGTKFSGTTWELDNGQRVSTGAFVQYDSIAGDVLYIVPSGTIYAGSSYIIKYTK